MEYRIIKQGSVASTTVEKVYTDKSKAIRSAKAWAKHVPHLTVVVVNDTAAVCFQINSTVTH